jgi:hypothetical protein
VVRKRTVVSHRGMEGAENISVESVKSVVKKEAEGHYNDK